MAITGSGQITLNEIHVEAGGASGSQASINDSDIRGLIGKASSTQMAFSEWYGASALEFIGSGTVTGTVANEVTWNSYSYGARSGDLVVLTGLTPWQLGNSGNTVNSQTGTMRQHYMGNGTSNPAFNENIASYVHNGSNSTEKWTTNAVYDGRYASVGIQIFRGPTDMVGVSSGASAHTDHAGWLVYKGELGDYYNETAPDSIPALSGYTTSFSRYSGNIAGVANNGRVYDHFYSNRQRTQYVLGAGGTLTSGANNMRKFELRT